MTRSRQNLVALLPMKAHSARVPNKNFREIQGKPLFRWIFDTLMSLDSIELVVINTDARDILAEFGVIDSDGLLIRDRKSELRGDEVSMNRIIEDDINTVPADVYLMTHTTNPLLKGETINKAIDRFMEANRNGEADSLFSVSKHQGRFYTAQGRPLNHDPDNLLPTQELEPWFEENSNLYIFTTNSFESTRARIGSKPILFETPMIESVDIDNMEDWVMADALISAIG